MPIRSKVAPPRLQIAVIVALLVFVFILRTDACDFVIGYFYQVTALRGRVVGTTFHGLPRWLRQSFVRGHAKLALYEYRWPRASWDDGTFVKTVEADNNGNFDFGSLKTGHYTLEIQSGDLTDFFDVEIKNLPRVTSSVTVDISPVLPDCTGGHEFIVKEK